MESQGTLQNPGGGRTQGSGEALVTGYTNTVRELKPGATGLLGGALPTEQHRCWWAFSL